jgi:hypothetical protein
VGRLLAPGGNVIVDGSEECPFSVLGTDKENMKEVVGVLGKLIRRWVDKAGEEDLGAYR